MGVLDKKQKGYFEDPRKFADLWNALVYEGEQVISWEGLQECNAVLFHAEGDEPVEKVADCVMKQTEKGEVLSVMILENQKEINYGMAAQVYLREALAYDKQIREIQRRNKKRYEMLMGKGPVGAYLYYFTKEDRLRPVSTLVLYWNDREWDGANSLREMINFEGVEGLKEFVPEFHLHVYDMSKVKHLERFRTDLFTLIGLYQRRGNKEGFREFGRYCEEAGVEKQLDGMGLEVLGELVKSKRLIKLIKTKKGEELSMCKAIEDIFEEGREEGREEGKEEGRKEEHKVTLRETARADAAEKELRKVMTWLQEKGISYAVD